MTGTVTITAANGVSRQVMVADRNADPTFDLCMDIWTDFGYTSDRGVCPLPEQMLYLG